jgi:hypothetical protein
MSRTGNTRFVASLPPVSKELAQGPALERRKDQEISLANADTEAREELFDLAGELDPMAAFAGQIPRRLEG